jgi:hypothetical protein
VYNKGANTASLDPCSNPQRIMKVFKDHLLHLNSLDFQDRTDIKALAIKYNYNYIYRPASVISVANVSSDNYTCAYKWTEKVYDAEDGHMIVGGATLKDVTSETGDSLNGTILGTTPGTTADGQIERYGIFKYSYDIENWVSRGVVFNMSNSVQYNNLDQLRLEYLF